MKPEEAELQQIRSSVASLSARVREADVELAETLKSLNEFRNKYLDVIAPRKAKVDELQAQLLAYRSASDASSQNLRSEADDRCRRSARVASSEAAKEEVDDGELRAIYRRAARLAHPDLAKDSSDQQRRTELMARVNDAYERRDAETLAQLASEADDDSELGDSIGDQLVRAIRERSAAQQELAAIEREIALTHADPLAQLAQRVAAAHLTGRDLLAEMAEELDRRAHVLGAELRAV